MTTKRPIRYRLVIKTLGPLHIGAGQTLHRDFDYVTHRNQTWVIDNQALAEALYDDESRAWDDLVNGTPAGQFLGEDDFHPDSPLFRYRMGGKPSAQSTGAQLQACIKDPWDRPYIPGSSLKGALRTAILFAGYERLKATYDPSQLGRKKKGAAQPLEHQILAPGAKPGKAPNYDLLRALQVSDTEPLTTSSLAVTNAQVFSGGKPQAPITLECLRPNSQLVATLSLDTALLDSYGPNELGWDAGEHVMWIKQLYVAANMLFADRIKQERQYWEERSKPLLNFYQDLIRMAEQLPKRAFLIQVGWGGGWNSKTLGSHLQSDQAAFAQTVRKYERAMVRQGKFRSGDEYPKSRRVALKDERPHYPLGWIRVEMERIK